MNAGADGDPQLTLGIGLCVVGKMAKFGFEDISDAGAAAGTSGKARRNRTGGLGTGQGKGHW